MAVENQNSGVLKSNALQYIRTIYLSLAAVIGLVCFIMGASGSIKLVLNIWLPTDEFTYYAPYGQSSCDIGTPDSKGVMVKLSAEDTVKCKAQEEENQKRQNQSNFNRQITESIALLTVGFPVWLLHFWLIQLDWKKRKEV